MVSNVFPPILKCSRMKVRAFLSQVLNSSEWFKWPLTVTAGKSAQSCYTVIADIQLLLLDTKRPCSMAEINIFLPLLFLYF